MKKKEIPFFVEKFCFFYSTKKKYFAKNLLNLSAGNNNCNKIVKSSIDQPFSFSIHSIKLNINYCDIINFSSNEGSTKKIFFLFNFLVSIVQFSYLKIFFFDYNFLLFSHTHLNITGFVQDE